MHGCIHHCGCLAWKAASGHCFNMSPVQAHRLVLLADKEGKASEAEDLLFEAIYENGKNVSIATLEQIGERLQLPGVRLLPRCPSLCPFILHEGHGIAAIKVYERHSTGALLSSALHVAG